MINYKELRSGNLINTPVHSKNPFRVDYFDTQKVYQTNGIYKTLLDGNEYAIPFHPLTWELTDCNPILLTPQILEKAGFNRKAGSSIYQIIIKYEDSKYPCTLQRTGDGFQICRSGIGAITSPIEYLHQLQNLYFELTREEITYSL